MEIQLKTPCKILQRKHKQYIRHYGIPAEGCLILPQKRYGDQLSCDVLWKNEDGELAIRNDLMFAELNLEPVDAIRDYPLHVLWEDLNPEAAR